MMTIRVIDERKDPGAPGRIDLDTPQHSNYVALTDNDALHTMAGTMSRGNSAFSARGGGFSHGNEIGGRRDGLNQAGCASKVPVFRTLPHRDSRK